MRRAVCNSHAITLPMSWWSAWRLNDQVVDELIPDDDPDVIAGMNRLVELRAAEDNVPEVVPRS